MWRSRSNADRRQRPFTLLGQKVAGSLVFNPTTQTEHQETKAAVTLHDPQAVEKALKALGQTVDTATLVEHLIHSAEPVPPEIAKQRRNLSKRLSQMARANGDKSLRPYTIPADAEGGKVRWRVE